MSRSELVRRYGIFTSGVIFAALGIALITRAGLGTSAVSGLPYVCSLIFPALSFGTFNFIFEILLFLGQAALLGRAFSRVQFLQLPANFVFSYCIDLWMWVLHFFIPEVLPYPVRLLLLLIGCVLLGFGVALEVVADVLILSYEGFVKALSQRFHRDFGHTELVVDNTILVLAILTSFAGLGRLAGLREGTIIGTLIVGHISGFFCRRLAPLTKRLCQSGALAQ